jgi:transglutaminase-like putative cysteine protease
VRIRVSHEIAFTYEAPVRSMMQSLRVMPRDHEGQVVVSWRIDPSVDGRLRSTEDAFGNLVHQFQADGPFEHLALRIDGVIENYDVAGFVRGGSERLPAEVFLRDTSLTQPDEATILLARKLARPTATQLDQMHALMRLIHDEMTLVGEAAEPRPAAEAFALRKGSATDMAHLFVGCAREIGVPARFVAGYLALDGSAGPAQPRHAWAEAMVEGYGWIGFDPALDQCPTDRHVRIAIGLDAADTASVRVTRVGGGGEVSSVALAVRPADQ